MMQRYELVLEPRQPTRLRTLQLREEDREVFDALVTFYAQRKGRRIQEHEAFTLLLADALAYVEADLRRGGFRLGA